VYIQGLTARFLRLGWTVHALNFRSCARRSESFRRFIPNRRPRLYHSGETSDTGLTIRTLKARFADKPLFAVGVSLGGNVLLKWLGENPEQTAIHSAATISVPYDLEAGARHLETRMGKLYVANFLRTLRPKLFQILTRFPETSTIIDRERVMQANSFYTFDDAATAPLHGFSGAHHYYSSSSSIYFLSRIKTPVLCISAEDDPFVPKTALAGARQAASPAVRFETAARGGHAGFISGTSPFKAESWAEALAVRWFHQIAGT
jgi:predicted alpha/beta-fold hydrolase